MFEQFISDYKREQKYSHMTGWDWMDHWERVMFILMIIGACVVIVMPLVLPKGKTMIVIWVSSMLFTLGFSGFFNRYTKVRYAKERMDERRYKSEKEIIERVHKTHHNGKAFKPFLIWVKESCLSKLVDIEKTIDNLKKLFSVSWVFGIVRNVFESVGELIKSYTAHEIELTEMLEALPNSELVVNAIALVLLLFFAAFILQIVKHMVIDYYDSQKYIYRRLIKTIDYMLIEERESSYCFE